MVVRICAALALALLVPRAAAAGGAAPTPAQLERAKQAFADGKQLHDAGKLTEAIEKFKQSYELSGNPLLLYNIGLTMQELGSDDLAVVYYRKFLAEAAEDAAQRQDASERIAALTRKLTPQEPLKSPNSDAASQPPAAADPAGQASGFTHHPIEAAPPGQPLDLTATVAEGARQIVTVFFRIHGQAIYMSTPMVPHGHELVGRIPAARMTGSALQYYVEVRDLAGTLIARSGKSTSPNVVAIDAAAPPRFYPDVAEPVISQVVSVNARDGEDPLVQRAPAEGDGVLDVGSQRFRIAKWSTTALAGASIGTGVALYFLARSHATALVDDATGCGPPPCQKFDDFDRDIERTGKREQTISNVTLFGGLAVAGLAGYLWFRELTADRPARTASRPTRAAPPTASWSITPTLTGAAAVGQF